MEARSCGECLGLVPVEAALEVHLLGTAPLNGVSLDVAVSGDMFW